MTEPNDSGKSSTRERILEVSEGLVLNNGYTATSISDIIEQAHITKGGFFYHFEGKNELAVALMKRYQLNDRIFFNGLIDQAKALVEDPLQQLLLFLKLLADAMANLPDVHQGCLIATFVYEARQVDEQVHHLNKAVLLEWREIFKSLLDSADAKHPKKIEADNASLADTLSSTIEGGIILSKALGNQALLSDQILHYRSHIKLLYEVNS